MEKPCLSSVALVRAHMYLYWIKRVLKKKKSQLRARKIEKKVSVEDEKMWGKSLVKNKLLENSGHSVVVTDIADGVDDA